MLKSYGWGVVVVVVVGGLQHFSVSPRGLGHVTPLSRCQHPGETNSGKEGLNAGISCRHGHGGTVPHYSSVNL